MKRITLAVVPVVGISLLPALCIAGIMYWTGSGIISRSRLDGSGQDTFNGPPPHFWPGGITIDVGRGTLYGSNEGGNIATILQARLDGSGMVGVQSVGQPGESRIRGMAIDSSTPERLYFADEWTGRILRACALVGPSGCGGPIETVASGLSTPMGVALDAPFQRVYWTDSTTDKIQRCGYGGGPVEDLLTVGLAEPVGIAVDSVHGHMYWLDRGTGKIQRAGLIMPDGQTAANRSDVEDLVTGLQQPWGIALDVAAGKMYWTVPSATMKIQRASLDGSGVEEVVTGVPAYWIAVIPDATISTPGDMNHDGLVNGNDIQPFVKALLHR